ncbi:MAG TPA: ABC transporter substrate-binding protein [Bosea sp. (in: a-proteobacteria)]|jgi:NitT/TauT family transport system substrate-binding protein|uniref:ABC transporter substrate-binding protein n=1 Tax=Bosea sp. (in: a-proteobacteria) TaxID=1871050 RepID=UPI002E10B5C8|nr:ABC transporter substrate-binding protein [Bosea sp. (in: a-proteobacteria)]
MPISRRIALKGLAAAAAATTGAFAMPAIAQGTRKVSFTTSWIPEGPNLFAYVARDKGFWKRHGLDVSVARGSGSGAAAQAVSAGTFDFGMAATPTVIVQAAKKLPITCIGQINYDALMGVGVLAGSPIRSPKDLEGKKLGASVTSGEYPFMPLYAEKAGFDLKKVEILQVDGKVRERTLVEKQVDAVSAFATSTVPSLAPLGTDVRFLLFSAVGIEFYGQSLTTQPARLQQDRGLCEAFVQGAMEAIQFTMTNFDEAVDIFLKANSEVAISSTGKEYARIGLGLTNLTNLVPEVKQNGFGWADPAKVSTMADLVVKYAAGEGAVRPDVGALFTNDFVGKLKLSAADLATAEKAAAPFRKYVGS